MNIIDQRMMIPPMMSGISLREHFAAHVHRQLAPDEVPVRFVVTESSAAGSVCELATLTNAHHLPQPPTSIFAFRRRHYSQPDSFNAVLMIPTGIGCAIGGHSGDATPVARLLAALCDHLLLHPNVVNASDINELPENSLSIEGSILCRLLLGTLSLQRVRANRVLCVVEEHPVVTVTEAVINAISAARATLGLHCAEVIRLATCPTTRLEFTPSGRASGVITGLDPLLELLRQRRTDYDAIALISLIKTPGLEQTVLDYYVTDSINPWGGIEAMLTHALALMLDMPTMHSPMLEVTEPLDFGLIDPRKASEVVSRTFTHCILKGLHRSPQIITDPALFGRPGLIGAEDIHCLVIPAGCLGLPTLAALEQGIPVIAVRENTNLMKNQLEALPFAPGQLFVVDNYLEAAGVMAALKAGVPPAAIRRPFLATRISAVGQPAPSLTSAH